MKKISLLPKLLLVAALCLCSFSRCKKPDPTPTPPDDRAAPVYTLNMELVAGTSPYTFGAVNTDTASRRFLINFLSFYLGEVRLVKTDGTETALKDILMVNFATNIDTKDPTRNKALVGTSFSLTPAVGSYKALRLGIGCPPALEPAVSGKDAFYYSNDDQGSPLAFERGLYWSACGIYRHAVITGMADTNKASSSMPPDWPLNYHTGVDSLYKRIEIADNFSIDKGQVHTTTLLLDINKLFRDIDLYNESTTHVSQGNVKEAKIGVKISNNLAAAIRKK